jgi:hypothetical protein
MTALRQVLNNGRDKGRRIGRLSVPVLTYGFDNTGASHIT